MLGPAEVVYHKGNKVWLYTHSNLKKVAGCKVKPYELIQRDDDHKSSVQNCDPKTNYTDNIDCTESTNETDAADIANDTNDIDGTDCTEDTVDELKIGLVDNYKRNCDGTTDRFDIEKHLFLGECFVYIGSPSRGA